ncbi:hypothetical protein BDV09DRAFT_200825 [Aspergillus tetrazonus]
MATVAAKDATVRQRKTPSFTFLQGPISSSTIKVSFVTQIIGDAASGFVGLGVVSTDEYARGTGPDGNDGEYYVNTAHFYSQIHNLRIPTTDTDPNAGVYNDVTQVSIYVARGFLIEGTDATWLYGTSSEHSVYYQYNFQ